MAPITDQCSIEMRRHTDTQTHGHTDREREQGQRGGVGVGGKGARQRERQIDSILIAAGLYGVTARLQDRQSDKETETDTRETDAERQTRTHTHRAHPANRLLLQGLAIPVASFEQDCCHPRKGLCVWSTWCTSRLPKPALPCCGYLMEGATQQ